LAHFVIDDVLRADHSSKPATAENSGNNSSSSVMTIAAAVEELYLPRLPPTMLDTTAPLLPLASQSSSSSSASMHFLPDPFHLYIQFVHWVSSFAPTFVIIHSLIHI
jgi:hypothetical protein